MSSVDDIIALYIRVMSETSLQDHVYEVMTAGMRVSAVLDDMDRIDDVIVIAKNIIARPEVNPAHFSLLFDLAIRAEFAVVGSTETKPRKK